MSFITPSYEGPEDFPNKSIQSLNVSTFDKVNFKSGNAPEGHLYSIVFNGVNVNWFYPTEELRDNDLEDLRHNRNPIESITPRYKPLNEDRVENSGNTSSGLLS